MGFPLRVPRRDRDGLVTQCGGPHHDMRGSTDPRAHAGVGLCHAGGEHEATGSERAVREGGRSGKANWQDQIKRKTGGLVRLGLVAVNVECATDSYLNRDQLTLAHGAKRSQSAVGGIN